MVLSDYSDHLENGKPKERFLRVYQSLGENDARAEFVDQPSCEEGCREQRVKFWVDYTVFIPNPLCKDPHDICDGICELRSDLIEHVMCISGDPRKQCSDYSRTLLTFTIATKYSLREYLCKKEAFVPYHRIGKENDINITERDEFGDQLSGLKGYDIAGEFISNFDRNSMLIVGPSWLTLKSGGLRGKPPQTGREERYVFDITARNAIGSDTVSLTIVVSP